MTAFYSQLQLYPILIYVLLGVFSVAVGSFLNVVIYRYPLMLMAEWKADCCQLLSLPETAPYSLNLAKPRSFCPACNTTIPFWHNIPLLSYCLLLGRCRTCHTSIPLQYPLVELLSLTLSLCAAWHFGFGLKLLFVLPFIWILLILFFIDLKHQLLPDSLTLSLLWLGLFANTQGLFTPLSGAVFAAAGAYLSLWGFIKLFYLITGKVGMGNGDFKLFAAFGAWFGGMILPFILIISALSGAIIGILYLKFHNKTKDTPIPFGPFLCMAGLLALFYGQMGMRWYLHLFI